MNRLVNVVQLILRGFFVVTCRSPHLIEVRERIRIDGRPVSKDLFCKHFWECWDMLHSSEGGMPAYFRFLTLLAFKMFLAEKVDVAVVEVGLGGRYDATNVIDPAVCGITSLGLEHTDILGSTLSEIAFHKAGIFKVTRFLLLALWFYPL